MFFSPVPTLRWEPANRSVGPAGGTGGGRVGPGDPACRHGSHPAVRLPAPAAAAALNQAQAAAGVEAVAWRRGWRRVGQQVRRWRNRSVGRSVGGWPKGRWLPGRPHVGGPSFGCPGGPGGPGGFVTQSILLPIDSSKGSAVTSRRHRDAIAGLGHPVDVDVGDQH